MTQHCPNNIYRRVINSDTRLQTLARMGAPNVILRNENRVLQDATGALFDADEIAQLVNMVGADNVVNYFNYIAGTDIKLPIAATAPALRAE